MQIESLLHKEKGKHLFNTEVLSSVCEGSIDVETSETYPVTNMTSFQGSKTMSGLILDVLQ